MTILTAPPPLLAGPPGMSAYALAVSLGYQGTLSQWLASFQGQNGVGLPGGGGAAGPVVVSIPQTFSGSGALNPATTYAGIMLVPTGGLTLTLCAASAKLRGEAVTVADETGSCSAANPITVSANGSDTISGQPSVILTMPYQLVVLRANSSNLWLTP